MKRTIYKCCGVLFVLLLVFNMSFVSAVSAETQFMSLSDDNKSKIKTETPDISFIKATDTSTVIQIEDILVSLNSDSEYTEARMTIKNLNTNEIVIIDYEVSIMNDEFETKVYYNGELYNKLITDYNPIKPISQNTEFCDKINRSKMEFSQQSEMTISETASRATQFQWDGEIFVTGTGVKYPHLDYDYYNGEVWNNWYVEGDNLIHYHLSDGLSNSLSTAPPVMLTTMLGGIIGAALGAPAFGIGAAPGAIMGGAVGAGLGVVCSNLIYYDLIDEESCIWFWFSPHNIDYYWIPFLPTKVVFIPGYTRVSSFTLWNSLDLLDPGANDWNLWNDPDSSGGTSITTGELQNAIHYWLQEFPIIGTGSMVTTDRVQYLIHCWINNDKSFILNNESSSLKYVASLSANRTISSYNVTPNSTFTVNVEITTNQGISALVLDEVYPLVDGTAVKLTNETFRFWNSTAIESDNSIFRSWETDFLWSSTISSSENRTVTYNVTVPANLTGGTYYISGNVSAYGVNTTEVGGTNEVYVMDDWNPWNDYDSEGSPNGRYITEDEVNAAYDCWRNTVPAPHTGHYVSSSDVIEMFNNNRYGTPM